MKNIKAKVKKILIDYFDIWEDLLNKESFESIGERVFITFCFLFMHVLGVGLICCLWAILDLCILITPFILSFLYNSLSEIIVGIILIVVAKNNKDLLASKYRAFKAKLEGW